MINMTEQAAGVYAPTTAVSAVAPVDPEVLVLRVVYEITVKYAWMAVIILGLFGNVMSIIINLQKDNRRISTCNYMTVLALADSGVLVEECAWRSFFHVWNENFPQEFDMQ
jgi:hypothetical protein